MPVSNQSGKLTHRPTGLGRGLRVWAFAAAAAIFPLAIAVPLNLDLAQAASPRATGTGAAISRPLVTDGDAVTVTGPESARVAVAPSSKRPEVKVFVYQLATRPVTIVETVRETRPAAIDDIVREAALAPVAYPAFLMTARAIGADGLDLAARPAADSDPDRARPSSRGYRPSENPFINAAIEPARESQVKTGVPASVTIAQAILESEWGRSELATKGHNYFGIKGHRKPGPAGVVYMPTWEVENGVDVIREEPFRAYHNMAESFEDHGNFFVENDRYAKAMAVKDDAQAFARAIHKAGYATDPAYSDKLIAIMEKYDLFQYDLE